MKKSMLTDRQQYFRFEANAHVERSDIDAKRNAEVEDFLETDALQHYSGDLESE